MGKHIDIPSEQYLKGLKDVVGNIQDAVDKLEAGSAQGLAEALLFVATEAQQRAPIDTGDLRGSVEVTIDDNIIAAGIKGGGLIRLGVPVEGAKGTVSFNTKYAARQHEQTAYDHPQGGQAKYLESVLAEYQDRILNLIAGGITDELED